MLAAGGAPPNTIELVAVVVQLGGGGFGTGETAQFLR